MDPSFPTASTALEISVPIAASLFAEMTAICSMSSLVWTGDDISSSRAQICSVALSIPRLISTTLEPSLTRCLYAFLRIALERTVAVVVPSPASLADREAASLTTWTAMF